MILPLHRSKSMLKYSSQYQICVRSSMDRASVFGTEGWGFDSLRTRHEYEK